MRHYILKTGDRLCLRQNLVGTKAANLARLLAKGYSVPPFFVLSTRLFNRYFFHHSKILTPNDESQGKCICPVGHFNHDCLLFDRTELSLIEQQNWFKPCNRCNIGTLARLAVMLQADFYIMTSALDIAHDLFLPAIRGNGARLGIFLLYPYSAEAFTFGLAVSGMKGILITFCHGDCLNHDDFTRADKGFKDKQTFIDEAKFENLKKELAELAQVAIKEELKSAIYQKKNNSYQIDFQHEIQ